MKTSKLYSMFAIALMFSVVSYGGLEGKPEEGDDSSSSVTKTRFKIQDGREVTGCDAVVTDGNSMVINNSPWFITPNAKGCYEIYNSMCMMDDIRLKANIIGGDTAREDKQPTSWLGRAWKSTWSRIGSIFDNAIHLNGLIKRGVKKTSIETYQDQFSTGITNGNCDTPLYRFVPENVRSQEKMWDDLYSSMSKKTCLAATYCPSKQGVFGVLGHDPTRSKRKIGRELLDLGGFLTLGAANAFVGASVNNNYKTDEARYAQISYALTSALTDMQYCRDLKPKKFEDEMAAYKANMNTNLIYSMAKQFGRKHKVDYKNIKVGQNDNSCVDDLCRFKWVNGGIEDTFTGHKMIQSCKDGKCDGSKGFGTYAWQQGTAGLQSLASITALLEVVPTGGLTRALTHALGRTPSERDYESIGALLSAVQLGRVIDPKTGKYLDASDPTAQALASAMERRFRNWNDDPFFSRSLRIASTTHLTLDARVIRESEDTRKTRDDDENGGDDDKDTPPKPDVPDSEDKVTPTPTPAPSVNTSAEVSSPVVPGTTPPPGTVALTPGGTGGNVTTVPPGSNVTVVPANGTGQGAATSPQIIYVVAQPPQQQQYVVMVPATIQPVQQEIQYQVVRAPASAPQQQYTIANPVFLNGVPGLGSGVVSGNGILVNIVGNNNQVTIR